MKEWYIKQFPDGVAGWNSQMTRLMSTSISAEKANACAYPTLFGLSIQQTPL